MVLAQAALINLVPAHAHKQLEVVHVAVIVDGLDRGLVPLPQPSLLFCAGSTVDGQLEPQIAEGVQGVGGLQLMGQLINDLSETPANSGAGNLYKCSGSTIRIPAGWEELVEGPSGSAQAVQAALLLEVICRVIVHRVALDVS